MDISYVYIMCFTERNYPSLKFENVVCIYYIICMLYMCLRFDREMIIKSLIFISKR